MSSSSSERRAASAFTVLEIRSLSHNYEGEYCDFAPHVTCGFTRDRTREEALELHDKVVSLVEKYPDARLRVGAERVLLGRPGNPKVVAYGARVVPSELHDALAAHAMAVESGPFQEWMPHVSVHVGITEEDFEERYVDKEFEFSVKTTWDKRNEFTWLPRAERYPRVRRADGRDDDPIVFRDEAIKNIVKLITSKIQAGTKDATEPCQLTIGTGKPEVSLNAVLFSYRCSSPNVDILSGLPYYFNNETASEQVEAAVKQVREELMTEFNKHEGAGTLFDIVEQA